LKQDKWEQEDGQKRSKIKIIGERMQMLSGKGGSGGAHHSEASQSVSAVQSVPPDDEVPF
jgi:single-strand DNA-binding protein